MRRTTKSSSTKPSMIYRLTHGRHGHVTKKEVIETRDNSDRGHHHTHRSHPHHGGNATLTTGTHHHRRRPSFGDKVSGTWMRMKGSILRRPGLKAAGTRRERGTDGRGSHRRTHY